MGEDLEGVAIAVANLDQYKPLESRQVQFGFNKWELDEAAGERIALGELFKGKSPRWGRRHTPARNLALGHLLRADAHA